MVTADDQCSRMLVSCGRTWLNQRLAIVDPETMTRCPPDRVGEVWVAGPHVALGYWNQPEDTQRIFEGYLADTQEGPFLRTGDLGFLKDGELFITGRIKDMIIIDGRNLYPQDIELTVEQSHPAVRLGCCAAFSVDKAGEEQLVVVAEIDHQFQTDQRPRRAAPNLGSALDTAPDGKEIVRIIRQAVAEYHNVRVHDVVLLKISSISKTSSGKLQRHACRAAYLRGNLNVYER
jgi:acyl-CoA synthetase (AMP-forming)/AMP-acid ligase II